MTTDADRKDFKEPEKQCIACATTWPWALRAAAYHDLAEGRSQPLQRRAGRTALGRFLLNPRGLLWSEVRADDIVMVDGDGRALAGRHAPSSRTAMFIHAATSIACAPRPASCTTHMPYATALTLTAERGLDTALSQNAMRFHGRVAVDAHYNGLALDASEGERIARAMAGADAAFLGNHGVVMCGERTAHAYDDLYYLERACMVQVLAQSGPVGRSFPSMPRSPNACATRTLGERLQSELFFEALRRAASLVARDTETTSTAMNQPVITFDDGAAYEGYMGVWSRLAGTEFLRWLAPQAGGRWLDVGCGNGAFTELLLAGAAAAHVEGIDPSPEQLAFARQRLAGQPVRFQVGDAVALPFDDGAFDAAVMALVIFFVLDPARGVAEMARVVKPGGSVSAYAWDMLGGGFPYAAVREEMSALGAPMLAAPSPGSVGHRRAARALDLRRLLVDIETTRDPRYGAASMTSRRSGAPRRPGRGWRRGSPRWPRAMSRASSNACVRACCPDADGRITYGAMANAVKGRGPRVESSGVPQSRNDRRPGADRHRCRRLRRLASSAKLPPSRIVTLREALGHDAAARPASCCRWCRWRG